MSLEPKGYSELLEQINKITTTEEMNNLFSALGVKFTVTDTTINAYDTNYDNEDMKIYLDVTGRIVLTGKKRFIIATIEHPFTKPSKLNESIVSSLYIENQAEDYIRKLKISYLFDRFDKTVIKSIDNKNLEQENDFQIGIINSGRDNLLFYEDAATKYIDEEEDLIGTAKVIDTIKTISSTDEIIALINYTNTVIPENQKSFGTYFSTNNYTSKR